MNAEAAARRRRNFGKYANTRERQAALKLAVRTQNPTVGFNTSAKLCAYLTTQRFALEAGISTKDAWNYILALGRAIESELMRGRPVGIPQLGVIYVGPRTYAGRMRNLIGMKRAAEARGRVWSLPVFAPMPTSAVKLHIPNETRICLVSGALKSRSLKEQLVLARAEANAIRARNRTVKGDVVPPPALDIAESYIHFDEPQQDRTMSKSPSKSPKRGMIVEDREAAVQTDDKGRQKVAKVPSRADEAKRQGKNESAI